MTIRSTSLLPYLLLLAPAYLHSAMSYLSLNMPNNCPLSGVATVGLLPHKVDPQEMIPTICIRVRQISKSRKPQVTCGLCVSLCVCMISVFGQTMGSWLVLLWVPCRPIDHSSITLSLGMRGCNSWLEGDRGGRR